MAKLFNYFVSAVLVTDNNTKDVAGRARACASTLKTRYANYEVVVVDNGLTPEQLQKLKNILSKVPCLRVIRLAKSGYIDTAIFAGVEAAIGDYICILYNRDPVKLIPEFVKNNQKKDIIFGVSDNLKRGTYFESMGAEIFYWYNRKYLGIDIPSGSTYFVCFNRNVANALTRTGRNIRHFRHLAKIVGFSTANINYSFGDNQQYIAAKRKYLILKALDLATGYSSHPLRVVSYIGIIASIMNLVYAGYVVLINITSISVEKGWTTLSLQVSCMFFILFLLLAVLCEYVGKILVESRNEPPYHIMQELSSTTSLADETRRNVVK
jgi:glycosyltransferase involved in cell wall biosynthesis